MSSYRLNSLIYLSVGILLDWLCNQSRSSLYQKLGPIDIPLSQSHNSAIEYLTLKPGRLRAVARGGVLACSMSGFQGPDPKELGARDHAWAILDLRCSSLDRSKVGIGSINATRFKESLLTFATQMQTQIQLRYKGLLHFVCY